MPGDTFPFTNTLPEIVDTPAATLINELNETLEQPLGQFIRCSACHTAITTLDDRIDIDGSHLHRFQNPAGITFDIACFRQALGCVIAGESTLTWTWFSGYSWCYALCEHCGDHLGWFYQGDDGDAFYGLIIHKLQV